MSEVQNHLGEKFKETIAEAMKTGDFRALNTLVSDTVNDALREADFQANLSREAAEKKIWNSQRSWQDKKREEEKSEEQIQAEREERERQREEHRRQNEEWHRQREEREKQWEEQWEEQRKARAAQKPFWKSGRCLDTQKDYGFGDDFFGKNGEKRKRVRNSVYRVRWHRTRLFRAWTFGTASSGCF